MNRRNFLKVAGGAGVILAAGAGGFLATRSPATALEPWKQAGSIYSDPMRKALSYALLAPNPHNRQPWQINLISENEGVLSCDLDRRLPETDPFDRQIVIGLGCFLELFSLAAKADGQRAEITLFPDGAPSGGEEGRLDARPIAHLKLVKEAGVEPGPLFAHVFDRRTNREAYDLARPLATSIQQDMIKSVQTQSASGANPTIEFATKPELVKTLQAITVDGMVTEANTHGAHMESVNLMRIGVNEVDQNPDGISIYGPLLDSLKLVGLLSRELIADVSSNGFKQGFEPMLKDAASTPAFVWIGTEANDRFAQIETGRTYLRLNLAATKQGLSMQPVSQALQEYAEISELYDKLHETLAPSGKLRVQMLARIGYGESVSPAPRWPLETRILS